MLIVFCFVFFFRHLTCSFLNFQFENLPKVVFKKRGIKRKADNEIWSPRKKALLDENVDHSTRGSVYTHRRRSARIQGNVSVSFSVQLKHS